MVINFLLPALFQSGAVLDYANTGGARNAAEEATADCGNGILSRTKNE